MNKLMENSGMKIFRSNDYNYNFDKNNGSFYRWGKTKEDDPQFSPCGPEIADIEISSGKCSGNCRFCYKGNGSHQVVENMSLDTFKRIFSTFNRSLTQIAFGICDIDTNPDFFKIMEYCRDNDKTEVIPNYTCNGFGVTDDIAKRTSELCGAVAVSIVEKESSYKSIGKFVKAGMEQVNIHYMLSEQTYDGVFSLVDDIAIHRVDGVRAVVFLAYKPKGRGKDYYSSLNDIDKYKRMIEYCEQNGIGYGFDSCSCPTWYRSLGDDWKTKSKFGEPCESGLFSMYCNYRGEFYPCSFSEGEGDWKEGIDVKLVDSFVDEVWFHPRVEEWRKKLLGTVSDCDCKFKGVCRRCPVFDISIC